MDLRRKMLCVAVGGLALLFTTRPASADTETRPSPACAVQEFVANSAVHIRDVSQKVARGAKRTGIEIGRQSRRLAVTFRDAGVEIWASATGKDEE